MTITSRPPTPYRRWLAPRSSGFWRDVGRHRSGRAIPRKALPDDDQPWGSALGCLSIWEYSDRSPAIGCILANRGCHTSWGLHYSYGAPARIRDTGASGPWPQTRGSRGPEYYDPCRMHHRAGVHGRLGWSCSPAASGNRTSQKRRTASRCNRSTPSPSLPVSDPGAAAATGPRSVSSGNTGDLSTLRGPVRELRETPPRSQTLRSIRS
jgi:hypothetical protein